ncbi:MAG: tetratricopeptide repeat protein [Verrucomicrobiales bacterium]|nr:tetratricopeptide repeat protein [Verrucomicrobiales bacterium]
MKISATTAQPIPNRHIPFTLSLVLWLATVLLAEAAAASSVRNSIKQAHLLFRQGQWREAIDSLERLQPPQAREQAEVYLALGEMHLHDQRLAQAVTALEKAVHLCGDSSSCHRALGEAYAAQAVAADWIQKIGLSKKIKLHLQRATRLDGNNFRARELLMQFYIHAPDFAGGDDAGAEEECRQIEKGDAKRGLRARLKLLYLQKRWGEAGERLKNAPPELASDPEVLNDLAGLQADRREFSEAFAILDKLIQAHPDYLSARYQLGRTAALSGQRTQDGIQALISYLKHHPHLEEPPIVWAHYRLGLLHAQLGDSDRARREYEQALERSPGHPKINAALKALASKQSSRRSIRR